MGRQRYVQKQEGMVLRWKHHREAIFEGKYHNFMLYAETWQDLADWTKRKPWWRKCKPQLIVGYVREQNDYDDMLYTLDVKNRVCHRQEMYFVTIDGSYWNMGSFAKIDGQNIVTKDGHLYSQCNNDNTGDFSLGYRFGSDKMIIVDTDGGTVVSVSDYGQDGYGFIGNVVGQVTFPSPWEETTEKYYMGRSDNGCFVKVRKTAYNSETAVYTKTIRLYEVTLSGSTLCDEYINQETGRTPNDGRWSGQYIQRHGGKYVSLRHYRTSYTPYRQGVYVIVSADGTSWTDVALIPDEPRTATSGGQWIYEYRAGFHYVYVKYMRGSTYTFRCWKSSDALSWTEQTIPDYVDIDLLPADEGHGVCQNIGSFDKIRLVLNTHDGNIPTAPATTQVWNSVAFPSGASTEGSWDIEFNNGTIAQDSANNWLAFVYQWRYSGIYYPVIICLQNMTFTESADNFAIATPRRTADAPETVQDDDYVYGI